MERSAHLFALEKHCFEKVLPLIKSHNELSVFSAIEGITEGKIYVNDLASPTAALIRTSECNYLAGDAGDLGFAKNAGELLSFWDSVTPDTDDWCGVIPLIHRDRFIRKYTRRRYLLDTASYISAEYPLPEGFVLEHVDITRLNAGDYKNADDILDWADEQGSRGMFAANGVGAYIRNADSIVSWSLSDCTFRGKAVIGIKTDPGFRKRGFARAVVNEVIKMCRDKGYSEVEWLCVDINKGSVALAEKSGFRLQNKYVSFAPYAPVENLTDLTEAEWLSWAEYFEECSKTEPRLLEECVFSYIKANNPGKVREMLALCENMEETEKAVGRFASSLHKIGMASAFPTKD